MGGERGRREREREGEGERERGRECVGVCEWERERERERERESCRLYRSDAADEEESRELCGWHTTKKKNYVEQREKHNHITTDK